MRNYERSQARNKNHAVMELQPSVNFVSDRLDYSVVEKGISNAGEREVRVFKQIAFYLKKVQSLAQTIDWQSQPNSIHAYSDLEHVRCQEMRKSTIIAIMIRCKKPIRCHQAKQIVTPQFSFVNVRR